MSKIKPPKSVWIDWRIPGPRTYVIPNDSAVGERPFPNRSTKGVLSRRLIYGSYRKAIKEQYLGHEDDLPRAAQEGDCSALQRSSGPGAPLASPDVKASGGPATPVADAASQPWVTLEGRAGIPSDVEDVEATMICFVYQAGIEPAGDGYAIVLR